MKSFYCLLIGGLLCFGCGKKAEAQKQDAAKAAAAAAAAQAETAAKPLEGVVDPNLTAALKSFVQEKGRMPESFFELKNAKLDSVPRAPTGFAYAIDPATVEVKLVKQ